jgi:hypothetical protein
MTEDIPVEAYQLAEKYHLGTPTAVHRVNYPRSDIRFYLLYMLATLFMCALLIVVIVLFLIDISSHRHVYPWASILLLSLNIIFLAFQRVVVWRKRPPINFFMRDLSVYVCSEGLLYIKRRKPDVIRWNEIRLVQRDRFTNTTFTNALTIYRKDRKVFLFPKIISGIDELSATIEHQHARHRY